MKVKSLFLASLTLLFLAGCSKDDENLESQKSSNDLFIQIGNLGESTNTRSVSPEVTEADADKAEFKDGILYFMTTNERVVRHYTIVEQYTNPDAPDMEKEVLIKDLKVGKRFTKVPATVAQVYVAANLKSTGIVLPTAVDTQLKNIKKVLFGIGSQQDSKSVTLDGIAPVERIPAGVSYGDAQQTGDMHAVVTIVPMISRIELHEVKAGGALQEFALRGVFLSNFYPQMGLDLDQHFLKSQVQTAQKFDDTDQVYQSHSYMCDFSGNAEVDGNWGFGRVTPATSVKPDQTNSEGDKPNVWSYHVFPGGGCTGCDPRFPSLVIRIDNITANGISYDDKANKKTQYVTIRGFLDAQTNQQITLLERGKVYKIKELVVTDKNINHVPDPATIDLWVKVVVANWEVIEVKPII